MNARPLAVGLVLLVAFAGCLGGPAADTAAPEATDTPTPDRTATPTVQSPTAATSDDTHTPTADRGTPTPATAAETTSIEYVVRAGDLPDEVASATVTMAVAFAESNIYHCDGDMRSDGSGGLSTPTQTPDRDRDLDCLRYGNHTLDLVELNGSQSIGAYAVPSSAVAEYALVVRDVTLTLDNGTVVEDVYAEHFRAHTARDARNRTVGVEIDIDNRPADATPRPDPRPHPDSPYEAGSSDFRPEGGDPPVRYALSTGGSVADGEVTLRATRDGQPADVTVTAVGAVESRYRTGSDGLVAVEIASPEIVEFEVKTGEA